MLIKLTSILSLIFVIVCRWRRWNARWTGRSL